MKKKWYRSRNDKMIGGVCGGLAEYFDVDPTIIRILFVVGLFMGAGILAYIVLWIVVPEEPLVVTTSSDPVTSESAKSAEPPLDEEKHETPGEKKTNRKNKSGYFGAILIVLGVLILLDNFVSFDAFWPLLLILGGIGILLRARND